MTYPQQPYGQQPQGYPGQQAPNYAPQPGYPAPGTAYTPAPQQYPSQGQPSYPPQGQPPQPEVRGTLKDFMDQPSTGGGPSLSFPHPGTSYTGTVVRNVTDADIQAQTDMITGAVATYNDRRPKLVMKVPLLLHTPHPAYPEGVGVWYVKGSDRAELARAMEAAGAEPGAPQAGDVITVTYTHDQPGRRGMNPTKIKRVDYLKGNGVPPQLPQAQQDPARLITQPIHATPGPAVQPQYQQPQPPPGYPQQYVQQAFADAQAQAAQLAQIAGVPYTPPIAPAAAAPYATSAPPMTPPAPGYPYGGPGPSAMVQGPGGGLVPTGPGGIPQPVPTAQPTGAPYAPPATAPYGGPAGIPTSAPAAQPPATAQPTAPAFPSNAVPGGPPQDWPADVPFIPGLTPEQARIAATMGHPAAAGQ